MECEVPKRGFPPGQQCCAEALYAGMLVADDIEALAERPREDGREPHANEVRSVRPGRGRAQIHRRAPRQPYRSRPAAARRAARRARPALKAMNGSGVCRSPNAAASAPMPIEAMFVASDQPMRRWRRGTLAVLRRHLLADPRPARAKMRRTSFVAAGPVAAAIAARSCGRCGARFSRTRVGDRRTARAGAAHVYLDVCGSMNAEMPLIIALLGRLSTLHPPAVLGVQQRASRRRSSRRASLSRDHRRHQHGLRARARRRDEAARRDRRHRRLHRAASPGPGGAAGGRACTSSSPATAALPSSAAPAFPTPNLTKVAVMIRMSEVVLPGHPDKFCDQVADAIIAECYAIDRRRLRPGRGDVGRDQVFLSGGICTRRPLRRQLDDIVVETGRRIGYVARQPYRRRSLPGDEHVCQLVDDPTRWTDRVNDQCIVIGWAGYDARPDTCRPSTTWRTASAMR